MKLSKGDFEAPVCVAGVVTDHRYRLQILDQVTLGEHFGIYQAEDAQGMIVCLKLIRYQAEECKTFASPLAYIDHRRAALLAEHRLLSKLSHPGLPAPLAMLSVENNSAEDRWLFRKTKEWDSLRLTEPVLVEEFFAGSPMPQAANKIKTFSLGQRLEIVRKVAKFCQYLHRQGYLLQNLHPSHLILDPAKDDNLYLVGLHHACMLDEFFRADGRHLSYRHFAKNYQPLEALEEGHSYDCRVDIYQLAMLAYYLLTLHDPAKDGTWWNTAPPAFPLAANRGRLEKTIRSLKPSALWLVDLLLTMGHPEPEYRLPDIPTVLDYLEQPPEPAVPFEMKSSPDRVVLSFSHLPPWATWMRVRVEIKGSSVIYDQKCLPREKIRLPAMSLGETICSVCLTNAQERHSWWSFQKETVLPSFALIPLENLPPDKCGFRWEKPAHFDHLLFSYLEEDGRERELCRCQDTHVLLPPEGIQLPFGSPFLLKATVFYRSQEMLVRGQVLAEKVTLFSPLPQPTQRELPEGVRFEVAREQWSRYAQMELLHNDWPRDPDPASPASRPSCLTFTIPYSQLDLFIPHHFTLRAFLPGIGWRQGAAVQWLPTPPTVRGLKITEEQPGSVRLEWPAIEHGQLQGYEISCHGKVAGRTRATSYQLSIPLISEWDENQETAIGVSAVYRQEDAERISPPMVERYLSAELHGLLKVDCHVTRTPFFVSFQVHLANPDLIAQYAAQLVFLREELKLNGDHRLHFLGRIAVEPTLNLRDPSVTMGARYRYLLRLEELGLALMDQTVEIPLLEIEGALQQVGYEECTWLIRLSPATSECLVDDLEITREGKETRVFRFRPPENETYTLVDADLEPGETYRYLLRASFQGQPQPYQRELGQVTARLFEIEESVVSEAYQATVVWNQSPLGQIKGIEIYDEADQCVTQMRGTCLRFDHLEPARHYVYAFKFRYFSGRLLPGKEIAFQTKPYPLPIRAEKISDSGFSLRWEITDAQIAIRIIQLTLEVSGNVGVHPLMPSARSVQFKQLHACTLYTWQLSATFLSGHSCVLGTGSTETIPPPFQAEVEIGLVHRLTWQYNPSPSIMAVEICRDGLSLGETTTQEMYDSYFDGGKEITYQFYYILHDSRKRLASEKRVRSLSLADIASAVKIQPGVGSISWDFNGLRNFPYLRFIELHCGEQQLYKKGIQVPSLDFTDSGSLDEASQTPPGLPCTPLNFKLNVVGVAPTVQKRKKRWVLIIQGIQCDYPSLPPGFAVHGEHCCFYLTWKRLESHLLQEIVIKRAGDETILYQGPNQSYTVLDDDDGRSLQKHKAYGYLVEMKYPHCQTSKVIEVALGSFSSDRLELGESLANAQTLLVRWNANVQTSIIALGWRRFHPNWLAKAFSLGSLWQAPLYTHFNIGQLSIPLPGPYPKNFWYQLVCQDRYGHSFCLPPLRLGEHLGAGGVPAETI